MEKEAAARRTAPGKNHSRSLENRQRAYLTGVSEVLGFDENQVSLMTDHGEITLNGEKFNRAGLYKVMIKFVAPVLLFVILLTGLGIL